MYLILNTAEHGEMAQLVIFTCVLLLTPKTTGCPEGLVRSANNDTFLRACILGRERGWWVRGLSWQQGWNGPLRFSPKWGCWCTCLVAVTGECCREETCTENPTEVPKVLLRPSEVWWRSVCTHECIHTCTRARTHT